MDSCPIMGPHDTEVKNQEITLTLGNSDWCSGISELQHGGASNIYGIDENAPCQDDSVTYSANSAAANSLQNFVDEALRSVEDGVASLDHKSLNLMVENQKHVNCVPAESCPTSNSSNLQTSSPNRHTLSNVSTTFSNALTDGATSISSRGLDLAQVVSEIFNDNIENSNEAIDGTTQTIKSQKSFCGDDGSGGSLQKRFDGIPSSSTCGVFLPNNDTYFDHGSAGMVNSNSSDVTSTNPSRLVVSPSVLSKVLSKNNALVVQSHSNMESELIGPTRTSPFLMRKSNLRDTRICSNKSISYNNVDQSFSPLRCQTQSDSHCNPTISQARNLNLSNTGTTSDLTHIEIVKLPQQPLPRSSLSQIQERPVQFNADISPLSNLNSEKYQEKYGKVHCRNYCPLSYGNTTEGMYKERISCHIN